MRLEKAEREARAVREELDQEIEQVKKGLMERLAELEPLPEALRRSELQLQEAQEHERAQDRKTMELSNALAELRMKVGLMILSKHV